MTIRTVKKAIFPVGGLGTRFLPATKSMPKEMLPIHSKPMIQHAFEEAVTAGIEQFIFITGRNKSAINDHFDYSYELEKALSDKDKRIQLQETSGWLPPAGRSPLSANANLLGLGMRSGAPAILLAMNPLPCYWPMKFILIKVF